MSDPAALPERTHLPLTQQTLPNVEGQNMVENLKSSDRREPVVIVSGHLDSCDLGTGVIDDAADVVVAMQVTKKHGLQDRLGK